MRTPATRAVALGLLIGLLGVAIRAGMALVINLGPHPQLLQIAVLVSALYLGWLAAAATLLVLLAGGAFFVASHLPLSDPADATELLVFPLVSICIIALAEHGRRLRHRLADALQDSERHVQDLAASTASHQRSELRLRHSEARFRGLVNLSPDAVFVCQDRRIIFANHGMQRLIGAASMDEVLRRPVTDFLLLADASSQEPSPCCSTRDRLREETWHVLDGRDVECEAASAHIVWDGRPAVQVVLRDVSQRKQAERKLALYQSRLEQFNADIQDFTHLIAHDLKEPVRGIATTAQTLLEDEADRLGPRGRELTEKLVALPKRLASMIDALLDYSRIGREQRQAEPCDLATIVQEVTERLAQWMETQSARLQVETPLPTLSCDRVRITELFANLISNGIKYNKSPERVVTIGARAAADPPVIYIRDNGIGIARSKQDDVFQMFRRLHPRDAFGGGTGAGLALCRRIIEAHAGRIWIESLPGQGSTFFFTLAPDHSTAPSPEASIVQTRCSPLRTA